MSDTAQNLNSNVNDIWSVPDLTQAPQASGSIQSPYDDLNQLSPQKSLGGSFGKPGLAGAGESGGDSGSTQEHADERQQEQPHYEKLPSVETIRSSEVGEKLKSAEVHKPVEEKIKESQVAQPEEVSVKGQIVDQRTGEVKIHRVAEIADKTTKIADIKEQEFIKKVEQVHSII